MTTPVVPTNARYQPAQLPEYHGNPLIAALPSIQPDELVNSFLSKSVAVNDEDRQMPPHLRRKMLARTKGLLFPLPEYLDVFRNIEDAIFESYVPKNPLTPTGQQYLHYLDSDDLPTAPSTGVFRPNACGLSLFGESGAGKSAGIERALEWFPQIILHKEFDGHTFPVTQVTWLNIQCPSSATVWGFALHILDELDRIFGTDDLGGSSPRPKNIDQAGILIERRLRSLHMGVLVLEELQNLNVGKSDLRQKLLNVFLHIINRSGIPILFCGNEDTKSLLKETLRNARRAEDGGSIDMGPIDPAIWPSFAQSLWAIQYTNTATPLSGELQEQLYALSRGLPGFAVNIYRQAQKLVIGSGDERLLPEVLEEARRSICSLSGELLDEIALPNSVSDRPHEHQSDCDHDEQKQANADNPVDPGIADINRVQHPEFRNRVDVVRKNRFALPLNVDPDVLRQSAEAKDPHDELRSKAQVLEGLFSCSDLCLPN
jgi:hypothetical protein